MNSKTFKLLKDGNNLKVGKNQIYFNDYGTGEPCFIVEKFEYVQNGEDMFSVVDGFDTFDEAYDVALNPNKYLRSRGLSY